MLPAVQACRKRSVHLLSLPAEKLNLFRRGSDTSIVYTPLFHLEYIERSDSFTTMFLARTTNFMHCNDKVDNTRTSECYASLNSLVCREWNILFTQVSDLFTIRCNKPLW